MHLDKVGSVLKETPSGK